MVHVASWNVLSGHGTEVDRAPSHSGDSAVELAENDVLTTVTQRTPKEHRRERMNRLAGFGIGLGSLFTHQVACHPFVVLRHQCQAHRYPSGLSPVPCVHVMARIAGAQGTWALWRGFGSDMVCDAAYLAFHGALATQKDAVLRRIAPRGETKMAAAADFAFELLSRGAAFMVALPFYSYSILSMVTSRLSVDSSRLSPAAASVFARPLIYRNGTRLSYAELFFPTATLFIARTSIYGIVERSVRRYFGGFGTADATAASGSGEGDTEKNKQPQCPRPTASRAFFAEVLACFLATLAAQSLLHPLETCVVRLHVQGTRALIDDPLQGRGLVSVSTDYDGLFDCWQEASWGGWGSLYAGAGAVLLQTAVHAAVVKVSHVLFLRLQARLMAKAPAS